MRSTGKFLKVRLFYVALGDDGEAAAADGEIQVARDQLSPVPTKKRKKKVSYASQIIDFPFDLFLVVKTVIFSFLHRIVILFVQITCFYAI